MLSMAYADCGKLKFMLLRVAYAECHYENVMVSNFLYYSGENRILPI
jgi:hypothetical protein